LILVGRSTTIITDELYFSPIINDRNGENPLMSLKKLEFVRGERR